MTARVLTLSAFLKRTLSEIHNENVFQIFAHWNILVRDTNQQSKEKYLRSFVY